MRLDIHNPTPIDHTNLCVLAEHAAFKICEMFRIVSKRAYNPLRFDTPDWLERNENPCSTGCAARTTKWAAASCVRRGRW